MKKIVIFSSIVTLLFLHNTHAETANTVEALLINATQKTDNPYMTVVKTKQSKSGWAIRVKKLITAKQSYDDIYVYMLARTEANGEFKHAFTIFLCSLLDDLDETKNFLPKQIIDMIFPKQNASCVIEASERAIRKSAQVNPNTTKNNDLRNTFPQKTPFELEVRFLTSEQGEKYSGEVYFLKLNFNIGGDINKK